MSLSAYITIFARLIQHSRVLLLMVAWLSALGAIILGDAAQSMTIVGALCLLIFGGLVLPILRWDSLVLLVGLAALIWLVAGGIPSSAKVMQAAESVLIFAALLPTMALVRATAMTMPSVQATQRRLSKLPTETSASGLQIAGHVFGGIINTGAFAMLSAALPDTSTQERRKAAAEAAIRGMVSSAAWSPFFVAFAIGQNFVAPHHAWAAIALGAVTALVFSVISLLVFNRQFTLESVTGALACLAPVGWRLCIVLGAVLAVALIFNLTALSAVVTVMPLLVVVQVVRTRRTLPEIARATHVSMTQTADDIVIISAAMMVAFFAAETSMIMDMVSALYPGVIPGWLALVSTPMVMMLASACGVHPAITGTALLTIFSGGGADVHPALLVQAHLIGWGAGTMCSVASLSVISCASLYRLPARALVLGPNLAVAFLYAGGGGVALSVINAVLT